MRIRSGSFLLGLVHIALLLSTISIAISVTESDNSLLWALIIALLITAWCTIDAKNRSYSLPHGYKFLIFAFAPIAFLIYVCISRGYAKGAKFIALQMLIYILVTAIPTAVIMFMVQ